MRACTSCFSSATWVANANQLEKAPSLCDFGHPYSNHTWPTTTWKDHFLQLLSLYEASRQDDLSGRPFIEQVQDDWAIFNNLDSEQIRMFIRSSVGKHPLLEPGSLARLSNADTNNDHVSSWAAFSSEIRTENRYFPIAAPDAEVLRQVFLAREVKIFPDVSLYRARVVPPNSKLNQDQLGAPPPSLARAGRANPPGIPYLYLSFNTDTCIYETRVAHHTEVAVGRFHAIRELRLLDLADFAPPDFFDDDETARLMFYRYLIALGKELSKPVQESDHLTDYIPTQYLCEFAKFLGFDGVVYSSALNRDGRNLVLFDVNSAVCSAPVKRYKITSLQASWQEISA